jgi:hypothetical protein
LWLLVEVEAVLAAVELVALELRHLSLCLVALQLQ